MIFFVEGPDGAGKTTLLKNIRADKRQQSYFLASSSQPGSWADIEQELNWIDAFPRDQTLFVDRNRLISEGVYGPLLRGGTLFPKDRPPRAITGQLTRFIYCRPSSNRIRENVAESNQLSGVSKNIRKIIECYDAVFGMLERKHPGFVMRYDYVADRLDNTLNAIFAVAQDLTRG